MNEAKVHSISDYVIDIIKQVHVMTEIDVHGNIFMTSFGIYTSINESLK